MCTLILSAPRWREQADHARSFENTVLMGVGNGYAIDKHFREQLREGCRVVVICRDCRPPKAVEGRLPRLVDTGVKTGSGMPRFDVHFENSVPVDYIPFRDVWLLHWGIRVLP